MTATPSPNTVTSERAEELQATRSPSIRGARLIGEISALLDIDKAGMLVPHGIGGHARELLTKAQEQIAELSSYHDQLVKLSREHPAANTALDTARREWAKREGA